MVTEKDTERTELLGMVLFWTELREADQGEGFMPFVEREGKERRGIARGEDRTVLVHLVVSILGGLVGLLDLCDG